jgi:cytoskeletal protein RodZ
MIDWDVQPGDFSFGRYLQRARLIQRIRLDDLSRATCIGIDNLIRLENDDLEHLPAEVFIVGYIRTYANAVGVDPEEALRRYHLSRQAHRAKAEWEMRRARANRRFWPRLGLAICVLAGLITLSIRLMAPAPTSIIPGEKTVSSNMPPLGDTAGESGENLSSDRTHGEVAAIQETGPAFSRTDKGSREAAGVETNGRHQYQLDIWAVKDLWLKAIVDDQRAQVYKLKKGDTLHLEALTGINLLIEDSAGVELTLDGAALPIPGKSGQVVNLEIP